MSQYKQEQQPSSSYPPAIRIHQDREHGKSQTLTSRVASWLLGDGTAQAAEKWVALVRQRSGTFAPSGFPHRRRRELLPSGDFSCRSFGESYSGSDDNSANILPCDQTPGMSLWERLGSADMVDIESSEFSWNGLSSLHHTEHTSSTEHPEDEMNKALEVTVNSGGVVFFALFSTSENNDPSVKEAAAVIKITSSRLATQAERLGYEFAKWLGVRTPQVRVVHNSSPEWQWIKDAAEKARDAAVAATDEVGEITCSELLEALELSRCLLLMKYGGHSYVHGFPLLESSDAFDSPESAGNTAAALGRVLMLDLVLRNEDRLACRQLGWRGNPANLMFAGKVASAKLNELEDTFDFVTRRYKRQVIKHLHKEKRAHSVYARLGSRSPELLSESVVAFGEISQISTKKHATDAVKSSDFLIVAIDTGVPRRPPAGKRANDQERYPKVVELALNSSEYSSNLLYEISGGKLGVAAVDEASDSTDCCSPANANMPAVVHEFRGGFRAALRDLQGFHLFLLTLNQRLDGLLRVFLSVANKVYGEIDKDDFGTPDSPLSSSGPGFNSPSHRRKEQLASEMHLDSSDTEMQKSSPKSPAAGQWGSPQSASPVSRDNWSGRSSKGNGESGQSLRLTMKLRDIQKFIKVDGERSKELEQWNEMFGTEVVKLCQENNFNTGFFEGNDNNIVVDAYELKVRLEHVLERIALITDAASTERPSFVSDILFIGGALAAKSVYTLQHLGITHILCLCSNEIGQSDSQCPDLFEYKNFSITDDESANISDLFEEASNFIDYVEQSGGKVLVHCFEGKSRSATVLLAYLMLRKGLTLSEAWNMLKKVHRRAQPNDGFAKVLLDLDKSLHGKASMDWQHRKPAMKVCPICGKDAGLSSSSVKLHLQKSHREISSGSVDSAMTMEIQKTLEALQLSSSGSQKPSKLVAN